MIKELNSKTNGPLEIRNFLNFLIKNKVYEDDIYLIDLKNSDNSNVLHKAAIYMCWDELDTLLPHLSKRVLMYKNATGLTLPQRYMTERAQSVAQITAMYKKCPESFQSKSSEFIPAMKVDKSATPEYQKILIDIAKHHTHHIKFFDENFFKVFVDAVGLKPFLKIENQEVVFRLFYTYAEYRKTNDLDAEFRDVFTSILSSTPEAAKEHKNFIQKFTTLAPKFDDFFLSIVDAKMIEKMGLKYLDAQSNSLVHHCIAEGKSRKILDFFLEHTGHYNTKNKYGKDIYQLALSMNQTDTAQYIQSYLEKKIFSLSVPSNTKKKTSKL